MSTRLGLIEMIPERIETLENQFPISGGISLFSPYVEVPPGA